MNVLGWISLVSVGLIIVALGVDIGVQIWGEKSEEREERKARRVRMAEAETLLYASVTKHLKERVTPQETTFELRVVELPQKPASGRHRLSAA